MTCIIQCLFVRRECEFFGSTSFGIRSIYRQKEVGNNYNTCAKFKLLVNI